MLRKRGLFIVLAGREGCCCCRKFSLEAEGRGRREGLGRPDGLGLLTGVLSMIAIVLVDVIIHSSINHTLPELCEFVKIGDGARSKQTGFPCKQTQSPQKRKGESDL